MIAATVFQNRAVWLELPSLEASRRIYAGNPFAEAEVAAEWLRAHSPPEARVVVLGSEPEIYFLAHRHSATGYIYTYPLMESQPFARQMQLDMIRECENAKPQFVVMVPAALSWLAQDNSPHDLMDWWNNSYKKNYEIRGGVDLLDGPSGQAIKIYERKTSAP